MYCVCPNCDCKVSKQCELRLESHCRTCVWPNGFHKFEYEQTEAYMKAMSGSNNKEEKPLPTGQVLIALLVILVIGISLYSAEALNAQQAAIQAVAGQEVICSYTLPDGITPCNNLGKYINDCIQNNAWTACAGPIIDNNVRTVTQTIIAQPQTQPQIPPPLAVFATGAPPVKVPIGDVFPDQNIITSSTQYYAECSANPGWTLCAQLQNSPCPGGYTLVENSTARECYLNGYYTQIQVPETVTGNFSSGITSVNYLDSSQVNVTFSPPLTMSGSVPISWFTVNPSQVSKPLQIGKSITVGYTLTTTLLKTYPNYPGAPIGLDPQMIIFQTQSVSVTLTGILN